MIYSLIQCMILGNLNIYNKVYDKGNVAKFKICFRCKDETKKMTTLCLDCKRAFYCSSRCQEKNKYIHELICRNYMDKNPGILEIMAAMKENYELYLEKKHAHK